MNLPVIIIGPICSGKTTISKLLSTELSLPYYSLDRLRWDYYSKAGMNMAFDKELKRGNLKNLLKFRAPYDFYVIEKILGEFQDGIIDFGAFHSYLAKDLVTQEKIQQILSNFKNIILISPTSSRDKNIMILNRRLNEKRNYRDIKNVQKINEDIIKCGCNEKLAKIIIYTEGKNPKETVWDIISMLKK